MQKVLQNYTIIPLVTEKVNRYWEVLKIKHPGS